jgi:hypothetical protein
MREFLNFGTGETAFLIRSMQCLPADAEFPTERDSSAFLSKLLSAAEDGSRVANDEICTVDDEGRERKTSLNPAADDVMMFPPLKKVKRETVLGTASTTDIGTPTVTYFRPTFFHSNVKRGVPCKRSL